MIFEILEITDLLKIKVLLLTIDIEKAFDSVDCQVLINVLKTFGFEKNLIRWIRMLLKNEESCLINGGITTNYFKLERSTPQVDLISAYLFTLVFLFFFVTCFLFFLELFIIEKTYFINYDLLQKKQKNKKQTNKTFYHPLYASLWLLKTITLPPPPLGSKVNQVR